MSLEESSKNKSGLTFMWRIKDFHVCPLRKTDCLTTQKFTSALLDNTDWLLQLHPNFEEDTCLTIRCKTEPLPKCMQIELFIKKRDGSLIEKKFHDTKNLENGLGLRVKRTSILDKADLFLPDDTLSVGCCIRKISDKTLKAEKFIAYTELSTEKFSLAFPLHLQSSKNPMQQLLTLPLISANKKYPDFNIALISPSYHHEVGSLAIQIKKEESSFPVFSVCKLSLQDTDGNVKYLADDEYWFKAGKDKEAWKLKNSILNQENLFRINNSVLTLHCGLSVTDGTYSTKIERFFRSPSCDESALQNLTEFPKKNLFKEKLRCLYTDRRLCDFTIHVDGKEFPVHKTVLGTASPVFIAMFEQEMKEKERSELIIEDVDADTMQRLIDFTYTESVDGLQWDSAVKLLTAADKYEILDLKQICAEFINSNLSLENVIDALIVADLHQDAYLKKATEEFIFTNFKKVFESDKWNFFMENNMKLANNVMRGIFIKLSKHHLL